MSDHIKFLTTRAPFRICNQTKVDLIRKELNKILAIENSFHEMDSDHYFVSAIEEALGALDEYFDYDPTPQYSEEPAVTMDEMHSAAWTQHRAMHS